MDIKEIPHKILPFVAVLAVGIVGGVAIGWGVKPDVVRIEEKLKTVEVEKQVVVEHETVRVEVVRVKDTQVVERWHREKTEETKPDGTVTKKETEDKNIDSVVHDKTQETQVKIVEVEKQVIVEREKIVERITEPVLAKWHLGVLAGVAPRFDSPAATPVIIGVEAERRVVGPFFVGGFALGGSPVVGVFTLTNVTVGLKLGAEF